MKLIDTHTHLYVKEFQDDIEAVLERAGNEGVEKLYLPAIDSAETKAQLELEKKYPEKIFAMAGLHPCSVKENFQQELQAIESQLSKRSFAGIGESGLDFYWDTSFKKQQFESLHVHAQWAVDYRRPLIIHTRNSMAETLEVVKSYKGKVLQGIFHCFGGTLQDAHEVIDAGFYVGIGGVLTFKNSTLGEVIRHIDLKHIVLETDAPYLAPVPFRGKRNESSYLKYIAQKLAAVKNVDMEEVAAVTTQNAEIIYAQTSTNAVN